MSRSRILIRQGEINAVTDQIWLLPLFLFFLIKLYFQNSCVFSYEFIFFFAILAVFLGIYLKVPTIEMLILLLTIGIVFVSEIFNTMVEDITNLITNKEFHPAVKVIKDMAV